MNGFLEIFSDVILLATFQARHRERQPSTPRIDEAGLSRPRSVTAGRRFDVPERI